MEELYLSFKPYLISIAYRMLGSLTDAEDIVHDTFIKLQGSDTPHINNVKSYLSKMVTNRCINEIKSVRKKRESYLGTWLPEPIVQGPLVDPSEKVIQDDSLSYALIILMEELSAMERAVYVLKEAFQLEHPETASMLNITEVNCRKIFSRAKKKIKDLSGENMTSYQIQEEHTARFISALSNGSIQEITDILADDVTFVADGGGKVVTAINEIVSKERVLALLHAIATKFFAGKTAHVVSVNNQKGILIVKDGKPIGVFSFVWNPNTHKIHQLFYVVNPDKLRQINIFPF
ncbi:RNA polymerase sigma-70 factor (ECF subfamily) [Aneurinibacillus soli]|uniref:ECF RNA polymerase sigma factor SigJ n=1 Tax=Aneurinibacillus soli TaxID=1500254 RepID=A0A0U5BCC6_9BACL|nr:RNA polymerase sigma factor SigJ [Aneurinibacillus soli]PYE61761.1 RNA polymerase sigma-70 factor (ECF subfamily) [Aneurinibacillus soli]BAU28381.1 ECF RNA polymerase sigma factor SigJ [Aneurinibacillus soli]